MDILYLNKINYVLNYYRLILILDLLKKVQDSIRFHRFLHVFTLRDLSLLYF